MECPRHDCNWQGAPTALASHFEEAASHILRELCCVNGKWSDAAGIRVIESGELAMNASWTRTCQVDGHTFLECIRTHSDGTLTIHVVFAGPESMRAKYKCTVSISNDEYRSSFEGVPLCAHQDTSEATIHGAPGL